jgi:hypothetical protein
MPEQIVDAGALVKVGTGNGLTLTTTVPVAAALTPLLATVAV